VATEVSALPQEHVRAYDAIAVKETINRAASSRAATATRWRERLIAFAPAILDEVAREIVQGDSESAEEREAARERMLDLLTDLVCAELRAMRRSVGTTRMPNEQLARYLATTFVLVLDWWRESPAPAREANEYFRSLVLPLLEKEVG
jgi:hypothetical protein